MPYPQRKVLVFQAFAEGRPPVGATRRARTGGARTQHQAPPVCSLPPPN